MDGFWCSRCLNDRIDLLYMIGSFASGANVSLVAKNGTKKIILLLSIKSSEGDKEASNQKFHKIDPPKSGEFWFKIKFLNFQKPKIKLRKDPLKLKKIKTYVRRPQIKRFYKTTPPKKNGNSDSKYNFIVMKRGPKASRRARRAPPPSTGARRMGA